jgi:hypothetical protein
VVDKNGNRSDPENVLTAVLEEIQELLRHGSRVDLESYRQRYPDHVAEIEQFLPTLERLSHLKPHDTGRNSQ